MFGAESLYETGKAFKSIDSDYIWRLVLQIEYKYIGNVQNKALFPFPLQDGETCGVSGYVGGGGGGLASLSM